MNTNPVVAMSHWRKFLFAWVIAAHAVAAVAQTAPAQKPLIARDGGGVKPNVVINLDESTSMAYQYSPEAVFKVGGVNVYFPDGTGLIGHKDDVRWASGFMSGTVLADPTDATNIFQRQMRSSDVNTIYYNPQKRYLPWVLPDGTRMAPANVNAVRLDPLNIVTSATVNLNVTTTAPIIAGTNGRSWCTSISTGLALSCTSAATTRRFQPSLYYVLGKNPDGSYRNPTVAANYTMFSIGSATASTTYTKHPARTDCTTVVGSCTRAEELQNFANWFQYYRSRLLLAQASIPEAFSTITDKIRLGWGRIHKGTTSVDGVNTAVVEQGVRDFTLAHRTAFYNWIRDMSLTGGTPLRQAMYGVGQYYTRSDNGGPWSDDPAARSTAAHKSCRRAYHILVTDGDWNDSNAPLTLPSGIGNSDNTAGTKITGAEGREFTYNRERPFRDNFYNQSGDSKGTLADVAMHFWKNDLRSSTTGSPALTNNIQPTADNPAFWQHMVNFTVAMGLSGTLNPDVDLPALQAGTKDWTSNKIDDLWHAAVNSRGDYFSAKDPDELATAIRSSLNKAAERELREAGVATAATVLEANNRKYVPKYKTALWSGDVEAFALDATGQTTARVWSAASKLPSWNLRNIVTWDSGLSTPAGATFTYANLSTGSRSALGGAFNTATFVNFIRGDRSRESSEDLRVRESILGDFINTTPVYAKDTVESSYLALPSLGSSYALYVNGIKKTRHGTLYVGGNDGMLHGFKETRGAAPAEDGKEIFAYVPRAVYGSLSNLASRTYGTTDNYHTYFVDGPLQEADVHVKAPGAGSASWRNYLFGSTGAGARAVFALDITDPTALSKSSVRWEISSADDSDLGHVLYPIASGVLQNGKWVAIFGNGYGSTAGEAKLFVVDVETGAIQKLRAGTDTGTGLGGVRLLLDSNGYIQNAYAGDLKGNLWKFEYDAAAPSGFKVSNSGNSLFVAADSGGVRQPIYQPPLLFNHSAGGKIVVFGTGRLITEADADTTTIQAMYGVRDNTPEPLALPLSRTDLVTRSITSFAGTGGAVDQTFFDITGDAIDWVAKRGWVIDLSVADYSGLRIVYPPQAADSRFVLFSAVAPASTAVACLSTSGKGINFLFPVETGQSYEDAIFDTNGDGVVNGSDRKGGGYAGNADGVDAILKGSNGEISIQNTTGQFKAKLPPVVTPPSSSTQISRDRVWRRIINPPIR